MLNESLNFTRLDEGYQSDEMFAVPRCNEPAALEQTAAFAPPGTSRQNTPRAQLGVGR